LRKSTTKPTLFQIVTPEVAHEAGQERDPAGHAAEKRRAAEEAINTPFCPSQEKFHTVVLRGISDTP
jgi:hypothetical protein